MLSCSIWFSAPSFWMGGGLESRCVGRVYGADGAVRTAPSAPYTRTHHPSQPICWGHAVAQSLEALRYKPEVRGLDSRRCHRNFSLT